MWFKKKTKTYHKVLERQTVFCDVDNTLVMWPGVDTFQVDETNIDKCIKLRSSDDYYVYCIPHQQHIQALKEHKARGHIVVVWSQGGADWAEEVVKKLGIESIVDVVMGKPTWLIDDLPVNIWLPDNIRYYKNEKI